MKKQSPKKDKAFTFNYLLFLGLLGFCVASFLLFNDGFYFHEIEFKPKEIAHGVLQKERQRLALQVGKDTAFPVSVIAGRVVKCTTEVVFPPCRKKDSIKISYVDSTPVLRHTQFNIVRNELHRLAFTTDTSFKSLFFTNTLFFDKDALLPIFTRTGDNGPRVGPFRVTYNRDSSKYELGVHASDSTVMLTDRGYKGKPLDFFTKYPGFGVWALLMIFQMITWFIAIPISIDTIFSLKKDLAPQLDVDRYSHIYNMLAALGIVAVFAWVLHKTSYPNGLISNEYFMHGYFTINTVYMILGYVAPVFCFAGYIYTARLLESMLKSIGTQAKRHGELLGQLSLLQNAPATTTGRPLEKLGALNADIADSNSRMTTMKEEYSQLKKHFNIFFITSAFLLSLVVLETGSLFGAIGSMDLVRYLNAPPGSFFMKPDFIYLFGAVHSLLILVFYIPVKINMINLESKIPDLTPPAQDNQSWLSSVSNGLKSFAGIFTASSPFLIAIVQYIIEALGKK